MERDPNTNHVQNLIERCLFQGLYPSGIPYLKFLSMLLADKTTNKQTKTKCDLRRWYDI